MQGTVRQGLFCVAKTQKIAKSVVLALSKIAKSVFFSLSKIEKSVIMQLLELYMARIKHEKKDL